MHRYVLNINGKVQGVGFRFFTVYVAKNYNLTGWVKNCFDGSVKLEVQGKKNNILTFVKEIKKGNGFSKVSSLSLVQIPLIEKEKKYSILE